MINDNEQPYVTQGEGHRESQEDKPRFDLVISPNVAYEDQLWTRYAVWLGKGAAKYGEGNMRKLEGPEAEAHAIAAAFRHLHKVAQGYDEEDHMAAVIANLDIINDVRTKAAEHALTVAIETLGDALRNAFMGGSCEECQECTVKEQEICPDTSTFAQADKRLTLEHMLLENDTEEEVTYSHSCDGPKCADLRSSGMSLVEGRTYRLPVTPKMEDFLSIWKEAQEEEK